MCNFKVGDYVKCVKGLPGWVEKDEIYIVKDISFEDKLIRISSLSGQIVGSFNPLRFIKIDPPVTSEPKQQKSDGSSTDYYKIPEGVTDLLDLIEHKKMSFGIGNIFKACYRLGEKEGIDVAYDLRKIIFFAERALKEITNDN